MMHPIFKEHLHKKSNPKIVPLSSVRAGHLDQLVEKSASINFNKNDDQIGESISKVFDSQNKQEYTFKKPPTLN